MLELREEGGVVALGRVLTLIVVATGGDVERTIAAANDASREHPSRVIVVDGSQPENGGRIDAQIRLGADAGASEVVVLHTSIEEHLSPDTLVNPLLLPDTPIAVWWRNRAPESMSGSLIGAIAQRRISDVLAGDDPIGDLYALAENYAPGDTDLSWARTTLWRGLAAAALDQPPHQAVDSVEVCGNARRPSVRLFAAWFAYALGVPVRVVHEEDATAITAFRLFRQAGMICMRRPEGSAVLTITAPGQPEQQIAMPLRTTADCLMEDLRRLDADTIYGATLTQGLSAITISEEVLP
nr:glucose-6-phosphate dehydrogenase assembly protein OpcA [Pseudactinotalea sp. HY160]